MEGQVNSLAHFQSHSRLHFIGQWRTKAEDYLASLYRDHPEWNHGHLAAQRIFVHLDMDAYFCSVALSKEENASYRDKPVAIAAGKQHSDVSSCNYIARSCGVRAGMWVGEARKLCPQLITLGYDLARCEELNKEIYRVILSSTPPGLEISLEVYSVDEVMIATSCADYEVVRGYCETVREEIARVSNGCTASCGVAHNIFFARLATSLAKPNGVKVVLPSDVPSMLRQTPITDLHGIGRVTLRKLMPLIPRRSSSSSCRGSTFPAHLGPPGLMRNPLDASDVTDERAEPQHDGDCRGDAGATSGAMDEDLSQGSDVPPEVATCEELQRVSKATLQEALGKKMGEQLYALCRGTDPRLVKRTGDAEEQLLLGKGLPNAVGCSMNYAVRPQTTKDMSHIVQQVIGDVAAKLRRLHACATHARLIILERHPDYPKVTTKFMGTGRCVEQTISVPLGVQAVTGEQESLLVEACDAAMLPRLTLCAEERSRRPDSLLLEDVRGVTLQLSGLRSVMRRSDTCSEMGPQFRRRIGAGAMDGQVSLTAAFNVVLQRQKRTRSSSVEHDHHSIGQVPQIVVSDDEVVVNSENPTPIELGRTPVADDSANVVHRDCPSVEILSLAGGADLSPIPEASLSLRGVLCVIGKELHNPSHNSEQLEARLLHITRCAVDNFVLQSDLASCRGLLRQATLWISSSPRQPTTSADATQRGISPCCYRLMHEIVMRGVSAWAQQHGASPLSTTTLRL